jgi:hypothetical protein
VTCEDSTRTDDPEFRYLLTVEGVPIGLTVRDAEFAVQTARDVKRAIPHAVVAVQVIFES